MKPAEKSNTQSEGYLWEDRDLQVPKRITLKGVPGEAKAVYVTMKSFGPEARSSLGALATRLEWTVPRARIWQAWLWERRWIWLLREGENKKPRLWWMSAKAGEQPPQDLVTRVCKNSTLPPQGIYFQQGADKPAPGKTAPETDKALQADNESSSETDKTAKAVEAEDDKAIQSQAWNALKAVWSKKNPSTPDLKWPAATMRGWASLLISEAKRLGVPELERRWSNMVNDPWVKASLRAFIMDTDKWITLRTAQASGGSARQFHQPIVTEHAPSLKVPPHD